MVFKKLRKINVNNAEISVLRVGDEDYISLTDMIQNLEGDEHIAVNEERIKRGDKSTWPIENINNYKARKAALK